MPTTTDFIPLEYVLPDWLTEYIDIPDDLNAIGFTEVEASVMNGALFEASGTMVVLAELEFPLFFIPGLSLVFMPGESGTSEFPFSVSVDFDQSSITIEDLEATLRIESGLLKKVRDDGAGGWEDAVDEFGNQEPLEISLSGYEATLTSDLEMTVMSGETVPTLEIDPFTIGSTGIIVEISALQLILTEDDAMSLSSENIGYDWRGVYLSSAIIHFPDSFGEIAPDTLTFTDAFIGSGGISGTVTADWSGDINELDPFDEDAGSFFGIQFRLATVNIEFAQNTLVAGGLTGYLKLPFFEQALYIGITLTNDGDFSVSASATTEPLVLTIPDVLSLTVESISFAKEGDELLVTVTGDITPLIPGIEWPTFEIKGITISSSGDVRVEGGWIELPTQKALDFHGFKVEISKLGLGTEDINGTTYRWVGFSGGIQIVSGIPLEGGVDGLKVLWNPENLADIKLQISGISIAFEIADVIKFAGRVEFIEEEIEGSAIKGFAGGVAMTIIPLNGLGVDAQFLAGRDETEGYNFFYIYLAVNLPVGIPVVPPALGLYGLRGLFGYNVSVKKEPTEEWYGDSEGNGFYKKNPEGITSSDKWKPVQDALALGAGVVLRTLPDTGFSLSASVLLVVLIPGPVILIEGAATMVSRDASNPEDFPFKILAVIDGEAGTFLANVEVTYNYPKEADKEGYLLNIGAIAEVFFNFNDPSDWHLYLGQETPDSKRVRADILNFFTATSYFMLDPGSLRMGVWIGYKLNEEFGPLRVALEAWIEGKLTLSFEPIQAAASITLYGNVELSAFGIGIGLSVDANVSAEAPKPLKVAAKVNVELKTPLKDIEASVKLSWEKTGDPGYPLLLQNAGGNHPKVTENQEIAITSGYPKDVDGIWEGSSTSSSIDWDTVTTIPPDAQVLLNFAKGLNNETACTAGVIPDVAQETVADYYYKYYLEEITLKESDDHSSWTDISADMFGTWQAVEKDGQLQNSQLLIGATTSFEMTELLEDSQSWEYALRLKYPEYPCGGEYTELWVCTDFYAYALGTVFAPFLLQEEFIFYSDKPLVVGSCSVAVSTEKGIYTTDSIKKKCLPLDDLKIGIYRAPVKLEGVVIAPPDASIIKVVQLGGNPKHVIYSDQPSGSVIGKRRKKTDTEPLQIHFPAAKFPTLPDKVDITLILADHSTAELRVYDAADKLVQIVGASSPGHLVEVMKVLTHAAGIARIEVRGLAVVYITHICYYLPPVPEIKVTLPDDAAEVKLRFCPPLQGSASAVGTILAVNVEDTVVQSVPLSSMDAEGWIHIVESEESIRALRISGQFILREVCYLSTDEAANRDAYNDAKTLNESLLEAIWGKTSVDIFSPNKFYQLTVTTRAERKKKTADDWETPVTFVEYVGFKTGNPPGIIEGATVSTDTSNQKSYPDGGPLVNLDAYVLRSIPAAAAASAAQSLAYRSYDVGVQFNEEYVVQMYMEAGFALTVQLWDNNGHPVTDAEGATAYIVNLWEAYARHELTHAQTLMQELTENCVGWGTSETTEETVDVSQVTRLLLQPGIQYTAKLVATDDSTDYEVHSFNFITSAFVSFRHQMGSFLNAAWDHFTLQENTSYAVVTADLDAVLGSTLDDAMKLEQLMEVFSLPVSRPRPAVMEVTALSDVAGVMGLLLESPEPIDWERTALVAAYAAGDTVLGVTDAAVLLVSADIEVRTTVNDHYIEVLLRSSADLSGYTLHYQAEAATESTLYYAFPEDSVYGEGTLLRIFAGTDPATEEIVEDVHLYAGLTIPPFDGTVTTLVLSDADGVAVHSRPFLPSASLATLSCTRISSTDGTRNFLFVRTSTLWTLLADGCYRLTLTYTRDLESEDAPVLMRHGFATEEIARLEFSIPGVLPDL